MRREPLAFQVPTGWRHSSPGGRGELMTGVRASLERLAASRRWSFLAIFLVSFGVQCFFLTRVPERHIRPHTRWETEAVAVSLAERGTFSDPYALPTGPTAHLPPVAPAIPALIYKLLGLTLAAGYVAWLVRIAMQAAFDAMLPWVAGRLGIGRPAGLLAGGASAVIPVWPGYGEALTGIALALLLVASVRRWPGGEGRRPVAGSLLYGAAWGAAFHLQPALLPVLLGALGFELWRSKARRTWLGVAAVLAGAALVSLPWAWRNHAVMGGHFFVRSNFGLELRMGNHEGAAAAMEVMDRIAEHRHPRTHLDEARLVQEIGEVEYMRRARGEALDWIGGHPGEFARLTLARIAHFWLGPLYEPLETVKVTAVLVLAVLGLRRTWPRLTVPQRAGIVVPLVTYPLVYYVVAYMIRYTVPVAWLPALLAGAEVWGWLARPGSGGRSGVAQGADA
jgi:hypothetical protein